MTTDCPATRSPVDARWMRRALAVGRRGEGRVAPNPPVGAVIVRDGVVLGEGAHRRAGEPHAEVEALREAGDRSRGATLYVTLEPCSTRGRTPPCTEAIANAGVRRVVVGVEDPNPRHAGRGLGILADAGVEVVPDVCREECGRLIRGFAWWVATGRPWVTLKLAMSLDGRIAAASGASRWITGPAARARVHRERDRSDAVAVGANTVRRDDPRLTVRTRGMERSPLRVVVAGRGGLPADRRLFTDRFAERTIVAIPVDPDPELRAAVERGGGRIVRVGGSDDGVDPGALLEALGRLEVQTVLVEGGGRLAGALVRGGWANEALFFYAPLVLGDGIPAIAGEIAGESPEEGPRLRVDETRRCGDDWLVRGRFPCSQASSKTWAWWKP